MTMALTYHAGQIEVQTEANTRKLADSLAHWVGPVSEFATTADLILLAIQDAGGSLAFTGLSGRPPLVAVDGRGTLSLPALGLPDGRRPVGGLAISLERSRRARLNGYLETGCDGARLEASEAFTNCRKYIAPSVAIDDATLAGPARRERIDPDGAWLVALIGRAETSFLASVSPSGLPDVSHRGGPPGFLTLDAAMRIIMWPEYVGDGMFKSAGNVRGSSLATLLVPDFSTGDAVELRGVATYRTLRTMKQARLDALQKHDHSYPVQGEMLLEVREARRLIRLLHPRRPAEDGLRVTAASDIADQAPR